MAISTASKYARRFRNADTPEETWYILDLTKKESEVAAKVPLHADTLGHEGEWVIGFADLSYLEVKITPYGYVHRIEVSPAGRRLWCRKVLDGSFNPMSVSQIQVVVDAEKTRREVSELLLTAISDAKGDPTDENIERLRHLAEALRRLSEADPDGSVPEIRESAEREE